MHKINKLSHTLILRSISALLALTCLLDVSLGFCLDTQKQSEAIPVRILLIMHGDSITGAGSQTHDISKKLFQEWQSAGGNRNKECVLWLESAAPTVISSLVVINPFFLIAVISQATGLSFETITSILLYPEKFSSPARASFDQAMRAIYEQRTQFDIKLTKQSKLTVGKFETAAVAFLRHHYGNDHVHIIREEATYESWLDFIQYSILGTFSLILLLQGKKQEAIEAAFQSRVHIYRSVLYRDRKLAEDIRRKIKKNDTRPHFVLRGALHEFLAPELQSWKVRSKTINIGVPERFSFLSFTPSKQGTYHDFELSAKDVDDIYRAWLFTMVGQYYNYFKKNIDHTAYLKLIRAVNHLSNTDMKEWEQMLKASDKPSDTLFFENQKISWNFLRSRSPDINSLLS